jgi:hypothetical protein
MGIGVEVSCSGGCGARLPIPVGAGLSTQTSCRFPVKCRACTFLSVVDINDRTARVCSSCKSRDVIPYGHPEATKVRGDEVVFVGTAPESGFSTDDLTLTNGQSWCPACEAFTATFRKTGLLWD